MREFISFVLGVFVGLGIAWCIAWVVEELAVLTDRMVK